MDSHTSRKDIPVISPEFEAAVDRMNARLRDPSVINGTNTGLSPSELRAYSLDAHGAERLGAAHNAGTTAVDHVVNYTGAALIAKINE